MGWARQKTALLLTCLLFISSCIMAQAVRSPEALQVCLDHGETTVFLSGGGEPAEPEASNPEPGVEAAPEPPEEDFPTVFLLAGAGVLALLTALLAAVLLRKRKRSGETNTSSRPPVPPNRTPSPVRTEFLEGGKPAYTVKISDMNDPGRSWELPVNGELLIGRESYCQIQLTDSSVSRVQCKILLHNGALTLVNLSSTNLTRCNGSQLSDSRPLHPGDILKLGQASLQVDRIQKLGSCRPAPAQSEDPEQTQSLF